jgi:transposase
LKCFNLAKQMAVLPGHLQALLPEPPGLRLERIERTCNLILIVVSVIRPSAACPICNTNSRRIHSRYERTLCDLPWHGATVRLRLVCRRFYCRSPECSRRIFAERLPKVVRRHGRSTERFRQTLSIANPHHLKANAPQPKIGTIVDEAMGSTKEGRREKPVGTCLSAGFRTSPPCSSEAR